MSYLPAYEHKPLARAIRRYGQLREQISEARGTRTDLGLAPASSRKAAAGPYLARLRARAFLFAALRCNRGGHRLAPAYRCTGIGPPYR